MTAEQFATLNMWMGLVAVAALLQITTTVILAVLGYRLYARTMETIADLERRHVTPLTRRVTGVLDAVTAEVDRVRRIGDKVERTTAGISAGVTSAASSVKEALVPGYAVARGVIAAVSAFRGGTRATGRRLSGDRTRDIDVDTDRLVNEGGTHARTDDERE